MEITKETIQRLMASNQAYESFEQHVLTWASGRKALIREAKNILSIADSKKYPPDHRPYTKRTIQRSDRRKTKSTKKILSTRGICSLKARPLPYEVEYDIKGREA